MVQTPEQYAFCYFAIRDALTPYLPQKPKEERKNTTNEHNNKKESKDSIDLPKPDKKEDKKEPIPRKVVKKSDSRTESSKGLTQSGKDSKN